MFTRLLALIATAKAALTVDDCGAGKSLFSVTKLSLDPLAPAPGSKFTLFMDWTVPEGTTITDGTAEYSITWNYIPFDPTTEPLCQDISCPMTAGSYSNSSVSTWPDGANGYITSTMRWFSSDGGLLACVEIAGTPGLDSESAHNSLNETKALVLYVPSRHRFLRGSRA